MNQGLQTSSARRTTLLLTELFGGAATSSSLQMMLAVATAISCSDTPAAPPSPLPATNISSALLPTNNLGVAVTFSAPGAERVRIRYWQDGTLPLEVRVTPTVDVANPGTSVRIAVLGLLPETQYSGVVQTIARSDTVASDTVHFASGTLPAQLRELSMRYTVGAPTPGFTLIGGRRNAQTVYAVALDSIGRVVWYRGFDVGLFGPADTKQQANGDYTIFLGETSGWTPVAGYFVQFRPDGDVVSSYQAQPPLYTDGHDILLTFKGSVQDAALFYGYEMRRVNLTSIGGPADTLFAYHRLVEVSPSSAPRLLFFAESYFVPADRIEPPFLPPYDLAHPNSIDVDSKGNYIVSWRNVGEVTSFDPASSAVKWRLGGPHSTLRIVNDPLGGFSAQHCARMTAADRILIYDNGPRHTPPVTRAVEYQIDTIAKTATMIWSFTHPRQLFNPVTGCAQRIANGNTVVTFSVQGTVTEVNPSGNIVSEAIVEDKGTPLNMYRVQRIQSLYGRN